MRFSDKKYKILDTIKRIRNGEKFNFSLGVKHNSIEYASYCIGRVMTIIQDAEIFYYTNSISKKIVGREYTFLKNIEPFFNSDLSGTGIILLNDKFQFCFHFWKDGKNQLQFEVFIILNGNMIVMLNRGGVEGKKGVKYSYAHHTDELKHIEPGFCSLPDDTPIHLALCFQIFKKYAPIETLVLDGKLSRKGKLNGDKHLNETDLKVTVIDSTWFTNIIRTNGFSVTGHFRLQACGEGLKDRKLIWINEFEKSGYTLNARKEQAPQ
ncbi:MAG: hypothetical protein KF852_04240 [Saprospiraceae bacterium]|nr:hypothetical protein [Saprospiraceae bacterium]